MFRLGRNLRTRRRVVAAAAYAARACMQPLEQRCLLSAQFPTIAWSTWQPSFYPMAEPDADDTISEARTIALNSSIDDSIADTTDVDMYKFTASANQTIHFDIDRRSGSLLDSYIRLFDASGTQLAANDNGIGPGESYTGESFLEYRFTTAGTYYLGVSGAPNTNYSPSTGQGDVSGSTGLYTIRVTTGDPNDTIAEAAAIPFDTTVQGYGITFLMDVDMFQITVAAGQIISIDVDVTSGNLDPFIRLFDSSGVELAANDDAAGPNEAPGAEAFLEYLFADAGTYYIGVSSYPNYDYDPAAGSGDDPGETTGEFTIRVMLGDANDQISEASVVTPGSTVFGHEISFLDDVDMFAFTVTAGQTISFDVDRTDAVNVDLYIRLFNSAGVELAANDDAAGPGETPGTEAFLEYTFAQAGTYYLGVSVLDNYLYDPITGEGDGGALAVGGYALQTFVGDANDQISEAPVALIDNMLAGTISHGGDVDMYKFTAQAGQTLAFDLDAAAGSTLNARLRLFNSSGTELASNDNGPGPNEVVGLDPFLEYTFTAAGTYYIAVSEAANASYNATTGAGDVSGPTTGAYTLEVLNGDVNDQISEVPVVVVGDSVVASISTGTDVDLYAISAFAGERLGFDIDRPVGSTLDSYLRIFDAFGNLLAANNDGAAPGETLSTESYLEYTFTATATHIIGVSGYANISYNPVTGAGDTSGSTGAYVLTVSRRVASLSSGTLSVLTTSGPDTVGLSVSGGNVVVTVNGITNEFADSSVSAISIASLTDGDSLSIASAGDNPVTVSAASNASVAVGLVGATTVTLNGGIYTLTTDAVGGASLTVNDASVTLAGPQRLAALNLNGTTTAAAQMGGHLIRTASLLIGSTAQLDIKDNGLIVDYADGFPSPLGTIRSWVASGWNNDNFNGYGIISSLASFNGPVVGYSENSVASGMPGGGPFMGEFVDGSAIVVRCVRYGDANLDGYVNFFDLLRLSQNYNLTGKHWMDGDFRLYDQRVNINDLLRLSQNYNTGLSGSLLA